MQVVLIVAASTLGTFVLATANFNKPVESEVARNMMGGASNQEVVKVPNVTTSAGIGTSSSAPVPVPHASRPEHVAGSLPDVTMRAIRPSTSNSTSLSASTKTTPTTVAVDATLSTTTEAKVEGRDSPPGEVVVKQSGSYDSNNLAVLLAVESRVADVGQADFATQVFAVINGQDNWAGSGFSFSSDAESELRVILAEPSEVDKLCAPYRTQGIYSCQNAETVALNADRWRTPPDFWPASLAEYRRYLITHEVGHLIGMVHPPSATTCPTPGESAPVMMQQTKTLDGCQANGSPLPHEVSAASVRPAPIGINKDG